MPNSIRMRRSISTKDIRRITKGSYGLDIETRSVDRFRRDTLQIGITDPTGAIHEVGIQQPKGWGPSQLQRFHLGENKLQGYLEGRGVFGKMGIAPMDYTQETSFEASFQNKKFFRNVKSKADAQVYLNKHLSQPGALIGHNIVDFEFKKLAGWIKDEDRLAAVSGYEKIKGELSSLRGRDARLFEQGKLSASAVREADIARAMEMYEWMIRRAKTDSKFVLDTQELAKAMNAMGQYRGIIPKGQEIALGTNVEFLADTLLRGSLRKEYHVGTLDPLSQNALAPRMIEIIEQLKTRDSKSLGRWSAISRWREAWADPSKMKINSTKRAIESAIENLAAGRPHWMKSGTVPAKSYSEFKDILLGQGDYFDKVTQGQRVARYTDAKGNTVSLESIFTAAENQIDDYYRDLLDTKLKGNRRLLGMKLPKGLGKYALGAAGIGAAALLMGSAIGISGKDDDYNTIEGLRHGWFGSSRKYITDFGSGFRGQVASFAEKLKNPMFLSEVEKEREANQKELGSFSKKDLMIARDRKTLEAINLKRSQLREVKLAQYQMLADDADTLVLNKKGTAPIQIRLSGIDTPETLHGDDPLQKYRINQAQPFGERSTERLKDIMSGSKNLRLFVDPGQKTYGRYLGVLFDGNKNINLQLVDEGYASSLEFGSQKKDAVNRAAFMAAGNKAEREGRGIWGEDFFREWRAFSAGAGRDVTFNSFTDILRLAKNRYLAEGAAEMWEDGLDLERAYRMGRLYQATNQFSGSDDVYNTIQGMKHGWFSDSRKLNTDFGSGYKGPNYEDPTPFNYGGLATIGVPAAAAYTMFDKQFSFFGNKIPIENLSYFGSLDSKGFKLGRDYATYGDLMYNALRRFELGLGGIPKAFSLSTLMSPSILKDSSFEVMLGEMDFNPISRSKLVNPQAIPEGIGFGYEDYLSRLTGIEKKDFGIRKDGRLDRFTKVRFDQGKLFGVTASGAEKKLLEEARLIKRIHDSNITKSISQYAKSYENIFNIQSVGQGQEYLIAGGRTKTESLLRSGHAYAHETVSKYLRLVDDPAKALRDLFPNINPKITNAFESVTKFIPSMGVGGETARVREARLIGSVPTLLGRHAAKALPVLLGVPLLYGTADWAVRQMAPEGTVAGDAGITGILSETARVAHMSYAYASEITGLTAVRKFAEERAPGGTGIAPFLGYTLSGFVTGTTIGMGVNLLDEITSPAGKARYESMVKAKTLKEFLPDTLRKLPAMGSAVTKSLRYGRYGAITMGALGLPALLFGLGSEKSVEELDAEYSGEKEVAVRKARWWEFGMTPWEGDRVMYYRPNWYQRTMDRAREKSIYGGEDISPMGRAVRTFLDPYWLEKQTYEERPYPIAGSTGEDLGIFGPLYEWTIGRVIKPPAYMHTDELRPGTPRREKKEYMPSYELGGLGPDTPISPYSADEQIKQQYYATYEAMGLRGFVTSALKQALTGEQDLMEHTPILQSSADIESTRRSFWDMNLGGLMGMTEPYRRFVPKRPYTTDYVNPLENKMPDWMPGKDYFIDFRSGDPYTKIAEGEYRLPGLGYAARFEELEGVDPENYPLIHQYKILADIAPYSKEFRRVRRKLNSFEPTDYEREIFLETEKQLEEKRKRERFQEDVYDESAMGRYLGTLTRIARANPIEQLTPLSPAHKFLPPTDAVSAYEESVYGKEFKLWQRPIDDFVVPFMTTVGNLVGIDRIPNQVQEARQIEGYFDKIEYAKFRRLERQARVRGSESKARYYRNKWTRTLTGADPYGHEARVIPALEKRDRAYFQEFMSSTDEDKERILELVPENTRDIFIAQWDKQVLKDIQENKLELTERERYNLENEVFNRMAAIRAKRKAQARVVEQDENLPDENWIGWRNDVDLDDVKLKYLIQTGRDYHYYDLWDDRLRSLRRKPYLNQALDQLDPMREETRDMSYEEAYFAARAAGVQDPSIVRHYSGEPGLNYDLEYDAQIEVEQTLREMGEII